MSVFDIMEGSVAATMRHRPPELRVSLRVSRLLSKFSISISRYCMQIASSLLVRYAFQFQNLRSSNEILK